MKIILFYLFMFPAIAYSQTISTFAGCGSCSSLGDGGPATTARIDNPGGVALNSAGELYIASRTGNRIRKIDVSGQITSIAGTGTAGYTGDGGLGVAAQLNTPNGIAIDTVGNVFFSDKFNYVVRKINATTGIITTICGDGTQGYTGDGGPATAAKLFGPEGISFDKLGNLYIAELNKHVVRKVNTAGIITTIAGTGVNGFSGDGLSATLAQLYYPGSVAVDDTGNIYISDQANCRIRKINTTGIISTYAGNGVATYAGDGLPYTSAQFVPNFIRFDKNGDLYIAVADERVAKIGTDGIFRTVAGNGVAAHAGDGGPATAASMHNPVDVAFDDCSNLYVSASANNRIRKVTFTPPTTPIVTIAGITTASVGSTVMVSAIVTGAGSTYTIKWMNKGVQFATTTVPTVTYTKSAGTDTITARVVPAVTYCYDSTTSAPHMVAVSSVGINELGGMGGYSIYPNPAQHTLTVNGTEAVNRVAITNLLGQVLFTLPPTATSLKKREGVVIVDIAHLPAGMYLIRVNDVWVRRFVKE